MRRRLLFTTPELSYPAVSGPTLRIETSIKALAQVHELFLISQIPRASLGEEGHAFYSRYAARVDYNETRNIHYFLEYVDQLKIEIIWFGYGNISFELMFMLKKLRPHVKMVCDTDSVWSRFVLRELEFVTDPMRRTQIEYQGYMKEYEEKAWVDLLDATTAVSEFDADYYRSLAKEPERVHVFSNVIDADSYSVRHAKPPGFRSPSIYLAGTFWPGSPMERAARWVVDEVLPILKQSFPALHLYILGRDSDKVVGDLRRGDIEVLGKVPIVLPWLHNVDVTLVPLFFESGTRFKILEAGICAAPVVSTTLGAEGLPVEHGKHLLIADTAATFASAVAQLLTDRELAGRLARELHAVVDRDFTVKRLVREARAIDAFLFPQSTFLNLLS